MDEKKTAEVIIEKEDDVLENFAQPERKAAGKKDTANKKILIAAIAAALVLTGVILAVVFIPKGGDDSADTDLKGASVSAKLDKDKTWQADVETDKDGKIKENGSGQLLTLVPADIKKIKLENENGTLTITSFTPTTTETDPDTGEKVEKTEATQYTLVGFEDFELQSGEADTIASVCSTLSFNAVSATDAGGKLKDFGLDKPRAIAYVTYNDGTKAVIKVGADAPKGLGTYVLFGNSDDTVYLCDTETVSHLLYGVNDLMNLNINEAADDTESAEFRTVKLSGAAYGKTIEMKPSTDEEIDSDYIITAPYESYADNYEASLVSGGIRGLYAIKVTAVNPSAAQLEKLGLASPYAELEAVYPDTTVKLLASEPDSEGNCMLMKKGGNVVYQISAEKIAWVNTSMEKLVSDYVLQVSLKSLSAVKVGNYRFDTETETVNTADEDGEVSTTTRTSTQYGGKDIDEGNFETFFTNLSLLTKREKTAQSPSDSAYLTVVYSYSTGRDDDVIRFYKNGDNYTVTVNSVATGTVNSTYVEKLADQAKAVSKGDSVKSFW